MQLSTKYNCSVKTIQRKIDQNIVSFKKQEPRKINKLTTKNNQVATAYTKISNSRIKRNKTIYGTETGIVHVASEVKKYVKSLFGATSPEYAQISGIEFKRTKK